MAYIETDAWISGHISSTDPDPWNRCILTYIDEYYYGKGKSMQETCILIFAGDVRYVFDKANLLNTTPRPYRE